MQRFTSTAHHLADLVRGWVRGAPSVRVDRTPPTPDRRVAVDSDSTVYVLLLIALVLIIVIMGA